MIVRILVRSALLAVLPFAGWWLGSGHSRARAAAPPCTRLSILLAGYDTKSADVPGTFSGITRSVLNSAGYSAPPIFFSYRYPAPYQAADTYTALPTHAVNALHRTIDDALARCPGAHIDLIAYSLGGAVAIRYLAAYRFSPELHNIGHVVTLDSPVNGTSYDQLIVLAAALNQGRLLGSPTGKFLAAEHRDPSTRTGNQSLARALTPMTRVLTLASRDDLVVPPGDAEIPGFAHEFRLGRNYAACARGLVGVPACFGHDRILHDSRVMAVLRTVLSSE
jgi:pimeloyl-ACP methyl ester carboxylesterase